jgi:hypothetical protein
MNTNNHECFGTDLGMGRKVQSLGINYYLFICWDTEEAVRNRLRDETGGLTSFTTIPPRLCTTKIIGIVIYEAWSRLFTSTEVWSTHIP